MRDGDPAVHALEIAPEAFAGIHALRIRDGDDSDEDEKCAEYPITFRTVLRVDQRERKPCARDHLADDAKGEVFAGDVREEKRSRNSEGDERKREDADEDDPSQYLLRKCHRRDCSTPLASQLIPL